MPAAQKPVGADARGTGSRWHGCLKSPEACWPRSLLALRSVEVSWGWRVVSRWSSKVLRNRTVHTSAADVVASKTVCWVGALVVLGGRRPCGAGEERRCDTLPSVKAPSAPQHREKPQGVANTRERQEGGARCLPCARRSVLGCGAAPFRSLGLCPSGCVGRCQSGRWVGAHGICCGWFSWSLSDLGDPTVRSHCSKSTRGGANLKETVVGSEPVRF